jgi:hypothetical protein
MAHRLKTLAPLLGSLSLTTLLTACGPPSSPETGDAGAETFVAVQGDFACYRNWQSFDGGTEAFDGLGVSGEQRTIYVNKLPPAGCKTYPVGTIIVKDTASAQTFAMVKRGAGFNPEVDDWEWFELTTTATNPPSACTPLINWRGTAPPAGTYGASLSCNSCHVNANATDYVAGGALSLCQQ